MQRMTKSTCLAGLIATAVALNLQADDLFVFELSTTDGGAVQSSQIGGDDLPDLFDRLIGSDGAFSVFNSRNFEGSLRYGGVSGALRYHVERGFNAQNPEEIRLTLTSDLTALNRTFVGTEKSVQDQVEDFLIEDGANDYAELHREIAKQSEVAVTDGNPNSATGQLGYQTFRQFAMTAGLTFEERNRPRAYEDSFHVGMVPDVGYIDAGKFNGYSLSLPIDIRMKISDRVGLAFNIPLNYTEIESASVFHGGFGLGIPIKVVEPSDGHPWSWTLTPFGGGIASLSEDFAAGGLLLQGGGASLFSYHFNQFTLSIGNQINLFDGQEIAGYDSEVDQQLTKHGLQLSLPFRQRWLADLYGIYSSYLEDAAVDDFWTFGADLVYRMLGEQEASAMQRGYIYGGVYVDVGDDYLSPHARLGTGWKF